MNMLPFQLKGSSVSSLKNKTLEIQTPEWALPLFEPCRYKAAFGGRGSGKSHMFAEMLIEEHIMNPNQSSVCVREIQKSLNQSVKRLLELKIEELNAGEFFEVQDAVIKSRRGNGRIIFQGMQNHTADSIKSLEGYDRAWVEEAQSLSQQSLDLLRPTIRKPGSELWFTWNPRNESGPGQLAAAW
jgi:phage terminase large subunit